jgi:hypothetical protein
LPDVAAPEVAAFAELSEAFDADVPLAAGRACELADAEGTLAGGKVFMACG